MFDTSLFKQNIHV